MSASTLLADLRTRPGVISLGGDGADALSVRVQMPELWDTIAIKCAPDTSVIALVKASLDAFGQNRFPAEDYVLKLRGFEVLNTSASVSDAGAIDGSIFLLTYRRRRPVRL